MAGFFWNVRGFNKSIKHGVVKNWVKDQALLFGCLIETRVKERKSKRNLEEVFSDWNYMSNYEYNKLGRIWVIWKPNVRMTPVYKSDQLITCSVLLPGKKDEFSAHLSMLRIQWRRGKICGRI